MATLNMATLEDSQPVGFVECDLKFVVYSPKRPKKSNFLQFIQREIRKTTIHLSLQFRFCNSKKHNKTTKLECATLYLAWVSSVFIPYSNVNPRELILIKTLPLNADFCKQETSSFKSN